MAAAPDKADLQHLKRVSRIKHVILSKYLPPWAEILGSRHSSLCYFDCFAGPGLYESQGEVVAGSPTIAVEAAINFARKRPNRKLIVRLYEDDHGQAARLETRLAGLRPFPANLDVRIRETQALPGISAVLQSTRTRPLPPSFFLVDPYGHPLPVPVLNEILGHDRTELMINLMWWRINMDLANPHPKVTARIDALFGDRDWRTQPFMEMTGETREREFLTYFNSRLHADYKLQFKIRMDPEDRQSGSRTKYYLLHASNSVKAVLLMKEVMWPLGDEEGTFDYAAESQQVLISRTPRVEELQAILLKRFAGQELTFDTVREQTWELPFVEKHYRAALRDLEQQGGIVIARVTSKRIGIKRDDRICFREGGRE